LKRLRLRHAKDAGGQVSGLLEDDVKAQVTEDLVKDWASMAVIA